MIVTNMGKQLRMRRVFRQGKALVLPLDHPIYFGPQPGTEDPARLLALARDHGATAVLLDRRAPCARRSSESVIWGSSCGSTPRSRRWAGRIRSCTCCTAPRRPPHWGRTWSC